MTEEQIEQNARAYYNHLQEMEILSYAPRDFIAGAHSRDEEIVGLRRCIHEFEVANKLLTHDKRNLQHELDRLRHPWISVEDRLPEEGQDILIINWQCITYRIQSVFNGDIRHMKEHPELYKAWMLTPKWQEVTTKCK